MPALTTENRLPYLAWRRRDSTSGQRSSPLMVDAVPSVIESPNATTTRVSAGAIMSTASRKYQDTVLNGNADSSSIWPLLPAPGGVTYDVVRDFACHVIGPLSPTTWKLTASLRPSAVPLRTKSNATASLHAHSPGRIVTVGLPANATGRLVPFMTAAPLSCSPTNTPSNVTGLVPNTLDSRRRV